MMGSPAVAYKPVSMVSRVGSDAYSVPGRNQPEFVRNKAQ